MKRGGPQQKMLIGCDTGAAHVRNDVASAFGLSWTRSAVMFIALRHLSVVRGGEQWCACNHARR